ncbi:MAG: DoxX family protein [Cytophagia bacterium]|nr:DoxX family protein [Cytophagia bacterium]
MKNLFFLCSVKSHYNHMALLFFRVIISGALMTHGYGKMIRLLEGNIWGRTHLFFNEEFSMALVAFAEFICPLFVAFGLGTRLFIIPIIYTFLIIVFDVHFDDPFSKMEKGLLFLASYVLIFLLGPGKFSLDNQISKKS